MKQVRHEELCSSKLLGGDKDRDSNLSPRLVLLAQRLLPGDHVDDLPSQICAGLRETCSRRVVESQLDHMLRSLERAMHNYNLVAI